MIEIELINDSFLVIRETLERMGLTDKKMNTLYQSCHILHSKGKYYVVHFKQMLHLDGGFVDMDIYDSNRTLYIAHLLEKWGMCVVKNRDVVPVFDPILKIVPHSEKKDWNLVSKYTMGHVNVYKKE